MRGARLISKAMKTAFFGQYAEDAILFVLLRPRATGFYIDAGAFDPVEGSNTYKLYLKGWRGITIEPNASVAASFRRRRPRDIHLSCGVAMQATTLEWHEFDHPSMNTLSKTRAKDLDRLGYSRTSIRTVECRPLQSVVEEFASQTHIDLLSIDCEGMDLEVWQSVNPTRPTSVLIEDLDGYYTKRDGKPPSEIERYARSIGYFPIAQLSYSFLYVATDWRALMARSAAFDPALIQPGLLPKQ